MTFTVVGSAEVIRELLCGPQQHDEHCKGWRWHLYMQDTQQRAAAVRAEALKIIADRSALTAQRQADLMLHQWQSLRNLAPAERIKSLADYLTEDGFIGEAAE